MTTDRRALIAGVTLLLGLSLYLSLRIDVATDIAHFLPSGQQTEEVILANEMVGSELSRTMILLIDAGNIGDSESFSYSTAPVSKSIRIA